MKHILLSRYPDKQPILINAELMGAAINFVKGMYPTASLVPTRCRTPHDGIADAYYIAKTWAQLK